MIFRDSLAFVFGVIIICLLPSHGLCIYRTPVPFPFQCAGVLTRAVECWRVIANDGGISFGHALGKLFQASGVASRRQRHGCF